MTTTPSAPPLPGIRSVLVSEERQPGLPESVVTVGLAVGPAFDWKLCGVRFPIERRVVEYVPLADLEAERAEYSELTSQYERLEAKLREAAGERDALAAKLETKAKLLADAMQLIAEYEAQWGSDYLAEKWGLVEERKRIETAGREWA